MSLTLMISFGAILIVGVFIGLMIDVDTFAGGIFSNLKKTKDPHRED